MMSTGLWYRAVLSGEQIEAGFVAAIRTQFAKAIVSAGEPKGACLFVTSPETHAGLRHETSGTRMDDDAVFFSPASVAVVPHMIAHYGARPSLPPERRRATMLVGLPRDWDLLPHSTH